ncbi:hypothetical protein V2J09_020113 [Rumex salicifolius]
MSGSPCGACKFLRRKCIRGCVFAPYFSHEQGATHFAAIHKVFGASNVSKLLSHLPVAERSEAAVTISYEAQARLQDPIYGCVSHIFALQQQVVSLQAQLMSLKQAAAIHQSQLTQSASERGVFAKINPSSSSTSSSSYPQDVHSWLQSEYPSMVMPQFGANINPNTGIDSMLFGAEVGLINHTNSNSSIREENGSFGSYEGSPSMASFDVYESNNNCSHKWPYHDMADDLHSVAFGYSQHS